MTIAALPRLNCLIHQTMNQSPIADLIVSTNDAKYVRADGRDTFPEHRGPDTLDVIDARVFPPRLVTRVEVATTIIGPPQAVAIHPAGKLVVVGATSHLDREQGRVVFERELQIVDLDLAPERVVTLTPAHVVARVDIGAHPQGLAFNHSGDLLLAATTEGTVVVLHVRDKQVVLDSVIKVSERRLAGITITPDGTAALVALRDEQGVAVLNIDGQKVTLAGERVSTGVAPYAIDVCSNGRWAVVGNVGLPGLAGTVGQICADADTITLVDLSARPFRAVQHVTVPSIPEGVAISPDGKWVAVLSMDGSNLPAGTPGHQPRGRLQLFSLLGERLVLADDVPAGVAGQGIVFSADSRYVFAQYNVEEQIAVFDLTHGRLVDTRVRLACAGGPVSIRSMPR